MSTGVGRRIADTEDGPVVPARLAGTQLGPALPFSRAAPPQSSPQQEAEEKAAAFPEDPGQHSEQTAPAGPHTRMVPRAPSATKAERREGLTTFANTGPAYRIPRSRTGETMVAGG